MPGNVASRDDLHTCPMYSGTVPHVGGSIIGPGAPGILINGKPAALIGDTCTCTGAVDVIAQGSSGVLFNGAAPVCVGDLTAHGGVIVSGQEGVIISSSAPKETLPRHKIPFPQITKKGRLAAKKAGIDLADAESVQRQLREAAPEQEVPENSTTVTLTSTFAREQLQELARATNLAHFMAVLADIFGVDIPSKAYDELFEEAKNGHTRLDPKLVVKTSVPGGGAAFYNDRGSIREIWVSEHFVRNAAEHNERRGELMTALIEEYGHYLDYLLRNEYAQNLRTDALRDEGAGFAYRLYELSPLERGEQHFGDAKIDGADTSLIWDYTPLHTDLKEYVNQERQQRNDSNGHLEFYKAGKLETPEQYAHGNIEENAISPLLEESSKAGFIQDDEKLFKKIQHTIYLGNWLRDMSQLIDPMTVRPMSNAIDSSGTSTDSSTLVNSGNLKTQTLAQKRSVRIDAGPLVTIAALNPVKFSVEFLTHLVEISAATEFINPKKGEKRPTARYDLHLKKLREEFIKIDPENLGVYRPEEHLDNPMGLGKTESGINRNDRKLYDKFVGFIADTHPLHGINKKYGMKNYLRKDAVFTVEGVRFRTGYQYIKEQLLLAAKKGGFDRTECQIALGAGLHALEDFYAHTNYTEVALMKSIEPMVFPWVDEVAETGYVYDYRREYARMTTNSSYHILDEVDETKYVAGGDHQIAAYIPIVTGTFGLIDTAASVLPVFNEVFFGREIDPWRKSEPGDRTEADMVLLALCQDLDRANNGNIEPTGDGKFTEGFKTLLTVRDTCAYIKGFVPDWIREGFYWLTSYISLMYSFAQYFSIRAVAAIVGDAQTLLGKELDRMYDGNFRIGQNPSHTQVAKDNTDHPLHELSALLAIKAVETISDKMFKVWGGEAEPQEVIDLLRAAIRHPVATDWQDETVKRWGNENRHKVCESCSPSVMIARTMHALQEVDETLIHIKKYILGNKPVIAEVVAYFEKSSGTEVSADLLLKFLDSAMAKSQSQMAQLMEIKIKWDHKFPKPLECLPKNNFYIVKKGDTLGEISRKSHTTEDVLIKMNHLISTDLQIGQRIRIPYAID